MIIACPACSTRYVVPDSAIGVDGRTVRCAKCRHSWHQDGPELDLKTLAEQPSAPVPKPGFTDTHVTPPDETSEKAGPAATPAQISPQAASDDVAESSVAHAAPEDAASESDDAPHPAPPTVVETEPDTSPEDFYYDDVSHFDYEPPFRSRRNPLKIWTAAGVLFAALSFGTVWAVSYYGFPDWVPFSRPTFAAGQADLVLDFPADQQDRRELPNGSEFFGASGTVTNTGRETRRVPSILIVMRDERDRIVYSWEVVPPKSALAPGESMTINEAVTNVPKAAKFAEIGWKPS